MCERSACKLVPVHSHALQRNSGVGSLHCGCQKPGLTASVMAQIVLSALAHSCFHLSTAVKDLIAYFLSDFQREGRMPWKVLASRSKGTLLSPDVSGVCLAKAVQSARNMDVHESSKPARACTKPSTAGLPCTAMRRARSRRATDRKVEGAIHPTLVRASHVEKCALA